VLPRNVHPGGQGDPPPRKKPYAFVQSDSSAQLEAVLPGKRPWEKKRGAFCAFPLRSKKMLVRVGKSHPTVALGRSACCWQEKKEGRAVDLGREEFALCVGMANGRKIALGESSRRRPLRAIMSSFFGKRVSSIWGGKGLRSHVRTAARGVERGCVKGWR